MASDTTSVAAHPLASPARRARNICSAHARGKVLVLTGPTSVGKTNVGLALAERLGGEIISADSVQVYRGLDVGSDKIPLSERRGVKHHLLDIRDPLKDDFSAGDFYDEARSATADILARGRVPIVVGGTGFYLRMYMLGKVGSGRPDAATVEAARRLIHDARARRAAELDVATDELPPAEAWNAALAVLRDQGDRDSCERVALERNNWYRLERAVQVVLQTQRPAAESAMKMDACLDDLEYDFRPFFLFRPRIESFRRIDERVETMVMTGLLDEAKRLLDAGLEPDSCMAARAIGYRQAMRWLQSVAAAGSVSDGDIRQLAFSIQAPTRRLVKAQLTFHRNNEQFRWVDATQAPEDIVSTIVREFEQQHHRGESLGYGRLSKQEEKAHKRYVTRLTMLDQPQARAHVRNWLSANGYIETSAKLPRAAAVSQPSG